MTAIGAAALCSLCMRTLSGLMSQCTYPMLCSSRSPWCMSVASLPKCRCNDCSNSGIAIRFGFQAWQLQDITIGYLSQRHVYGPATLSHDWFSWVMVLYEMLAGRVGLGKQPWER